MSENRLAAMDVFKHLPRSNCRECGVPTCLAFAALVVQGQKQPGDCPYLEPGSAEAISGDVAASEDVAEENRKLLEPLKERIRALDFGEASKRLGVPLVNGRIAVRCLGKVFEIDHDGGLHTEIHANVWIHVPLLHYLLKGAGRAPAGSWVPFGELTGATDWQRFFDHRVGLSFAKMADEDPELFCDILGLFGKQTLDSGFKADEEYLLWPLPNVPVLFCYWRAEGEFASRLSLSFDKVTHANIDAEHLFRLTAGMLEMFKRIMTRHGQAAGT